MQACSCRLLQRHILHITSKHMKTSSQFRNPNCDVKADLTRIGELKLPEEPTTCCMTGCAHCVWIQYAEELSRLLGDAGPQQAKQIIMERVADANVRAYLLTELSFMQSKNL